MPHDVFISYSSKDKPIADGVCATLEQHGLRCWIAPRDITPGAEWSASIIQALSEARVFVLVLSGAANASNQIKREVERAVHNGLAIIPYRIEDVMPADALEYFISTPHWLDAFTPPVEQHAQALAAAIKRLLNTASGSAAPGAPPQLAPPPPASVPKPPAPATRTSPSVLAGGAVIGALALAAIGYFALQPKHPSTSVAAQSGQPSFVGDWTVTKVAWSPGVSAGYGAATLGELFAAVMNADRTTGSFSLNPSGAFQTVVEVDDSGTVTRVGPALLFSSADGTTAAVRATKLASAIPLGGQASEVGLVLQGVRRLPEPWVGLPDPQAFGGPLAGVAGTWRSSGWPTLPDGQVWTGKMTIAASGAYRLQLFQTVGGTFTTPSAGSWSVSVVGAGGVVSQAGGAYAFDGPDKVTTTTPQGSTTYVRK